MDKQAKEFCKACFDEMAGRRMWWVPVDILKQKLQIDDDTAQAIVKYGLSKRLISAGGEPPHTVVLTHEGYSLFKR